METDHISTVVQDFVDSRGEVDIRITLEQEPLRFSGSFFEEICRHVGLGRERGQKNAEMINKVLSTPVIRAVVTVSLENLLALFPSLVLPQACFGRSTSKPRTLLKSL